MNVTEFSWPPAYTVRKHRRARSFKLRATKKSGLVITVPYRASLREIPEIIEKHREWITKQLLKIAAQTSTELPTQVDLKSIQRTYKIDYQPGYNKLALFVRPTQELILLGKIDNKVGKIDNKELCKRKLLTWVKEEANKILIPMLEMLSGKIQLPFNEVTVRDQQTLWGSCTVKKAISLNYKLIFLPVELVTHVMIHELCHTKYLNHSEKFWRLVATFDPEFENHKRALRYADDFIPKWI